MYQSVDVERLHVLRHCFRAVAIRAIYLDAVCIAVDEAKHGYTGASMSNLTVDPPPFSHTDQEAFRTGDGQSALKLRRESLYQ